MQCTTCVTQPLGREHQRSHDLHAVVVQNSAFLAGIVSRSLSVSM